MTSDIAVGGEVAKDSSFDSKIQEIARAAGASATDAEHFALADSGCGISTSSNDKYGCNTYWYKEGESRYSVQAAKGDPSVATGITDWVICWSTETKKGWVLVCTAVKSLIIPSSVFYMIATGAKGIGYKGSPLSFMENVNGSGKPGIWQSDKMEYMFLTMKWQVPVVPLIKLPEDQMKTIAHRMLRTKDLKGIVPLTFPSPTEQYTRMEHEEWLNAHDDTCTGGNTLIPKEEYDRLARITTHLESELKKYADSVGKIDPLMFAHYLVHHRSPRALAKAVASGDIIGCDLDLTGAANFVTTKCANCVLATCREHPCGKSKPRAKHKSLADIKATTERQLQEKEKLTPESRNYLLKKTGFNLASHSPPFALIVLDEITGTGETMVDIEGKLTVNNVMVITCVGYNIRLAYGQEDMSAVQLEETIKEIIAMVQAHGCRCYVMRFDPSSQARAANTKGLLLDLGIHEDLSSPKVKNEAAMSEGSNAIYNHAARVGLANLLTTSDDGGGRDKKWAHRLSYLAGRHGLYIGNHLHNSGSGRVPMAELNQRPVNFKKVFLAPWGSVCIYRNENPRGKTEARGMIGIYVGIKPSATGEDQILIATVPELDKTGTRTRTVGRSRCYFFPQDNDPLRVAFKFAGKMDDYLKDLLLEGNITTGMEKLIRNHQKTGQDYSSDINGHEEDTYEEAAKLMRSFGPIPTEFASDKPQLEVPDDDLESIQPGSMSPKTWYSEADPTTMGQRVQGRTDRPQTDRFIPDLPKKVGRKKDLSKGPLDQADLTKVDPARWVSKTAHNALRNYTVHKTAKADTVTKPYRRVRLDMIDGTSAYEAIGRVLPNKGGTMVPYNFADLRYDLRTEVLILRSVDTTDPDDEDAIDAAAMAATAFTAADERVEVRVQPTTYAEVASANKASATVMAHAAMLDYANEMVLDAHVKMDTEEEWGSQHFPVCAASVMHSYNSPVSAVGGAPAAAPVDTEVPLHKKDPGYSSAWLIETALEFNKKCKSMEQLLATQPWPFAQAMISAAAEELKQLVAMGVFTFNGTTVRDCWGMGTSPLQVSEVATLKVSPDGVFEKCKWRVTINGSGEKAGVHYQGSSHHPAPSTSTTRYFMAGEANMPKGERCCQVDVSSAYNVPDVGCDGKGQPMRIFVRQMSWCHAVTVKKSPSGAYFAEIDWQWFEAYRERLLKKQKSGKKIIPEIYQRYLNPDEVLIDLTGNTYGRVAGGRVWMDYFCSLIHAAPLHFDRCSAEAAWFHRSSGAYKEHPESKVPIGTCDMIIHTDDMLITPGNQYEWFTQGLETAGLKITSNRTVEAHTGIKITYGETEDGMSTCTITQPQSIKKMAVEFKVYIDARRSSRRTAVQLPMAGGFKHEFKYELDLTDKTAVAEHKAFPYRGILGHIMWICYTHPEVWHASRVLARHSHHHTKHHRDALLDCALFLIDVAMDWGIRYTSSWTLTYLLAHPEQWHRVCNKIGMADASHCDDIETLLCTGGAGIMGNGGIIDAMCKSLKWVNLSTLSSEVKVLTQLAGMVYSLQQLEEEIERPDMEPMTIATDNRSTTQVVADPGRHRTMTTHVDRDAFKVREYVCRGRVIVRWCPTDENWSDIFTKPLANPKFTYFWHCMCGYIKWKLPDATDHAATGATAIGNTVQIDFDYWVKDVP
jgi:hypothetical protein